MKLKNLNNHIEEIIEGYRQQCHNCTKLLEMLRSPSKPDNLLAGKISRLLDRVRIVDDNISLHKQAVETILHLKEFKLDKVQDLIHPKLLADLQEQKALIGGLMEELSKIERPIELANLVPADFVQELKNVP